MKLKFVLVFTVLSLRAFGWGELGHHMATRNAARLLSSHPLILEAQKTSPEAVAVFLSTMQRGRTQLAHLGASPDHLWRNLTGGAGEVSRAWGDSTHFFEVDKFFGIKVDGKVPAGVIPLSFEAAKAMAGHGEIPHYLFKDVGTVPWRVGQFDRLLRDAFAKYPKECPAKSDAAHPTLAVMTYAGLLTHYLADAAVPHHAVSDYDGVADGLPGIHSYWESDLVDALDPELEAKVAATSLKALTKPEKVSGSLESLKASVQKMYPGVTADEQTQALTNAMLYESFIVEPMVVERDRKYAIASEIEKKAGCWKGAGETTPKICRRAPLTFVDARGRKTGPRGGKTVAGWNESLIVERLAVASAAIADAWARAWVEAGKPTLCFTWTYSHKPNFVSSGDSGCYGYAAGEDLKPSSPQTKEGAPCLTQW